MLGHIDALCVGLFVTPKVGTCAFCWLLCIYVGMVHLVFTLVKEIRWFIYT